MKKKIVNILLTLLLLFLMAYQVTGEMLHEWFGIAMTILLIVHHLLNRKWYSSLFKGKYNAYRTLTACTNTLLLISIALTAFCGMAMSGYAVPFLYGMASVSFARRFHLAMSHWSFVLMGLHLGLHIPAMTSRWKLSNSVRMILSVIFACAGGYGLFLFLRAGIPDYMFFRNPFAFLDYEKAKWLVIVENLLMLVFWAFIGTQLADLCRSRAKKQNPLLPVVFILLAVVAGLIFGQTIHDPDADTFGGNWMESIPEPVQEPTSEAAAEIIAEPEITVEPTEAAAVSAASDQKDPASVEDNFILIPAGSFMMGSPDTENWRIDDEVQHEVNVSAFYIDPYETTQEEYERLMGGNPSLNIGADLPVEQISWLDAVSFANAKSVDAGLTPAYVIKGNEVTWDRSANGYRLPTEAEWEYACRAGTITPFNTETSVSTEEANYWGSYPYEIEENYFNKSALETKPGSSRGRTVTIGSYPANALGLYDMHGNVNEWTWDYYGPYDAENISDPTGPENGTRHVYRGGGWNDFAKNLRSAYRAAGQSDMKSFNLGVRLVRNADNACSGIVTAAEGIPETETNGKMLIAFYSWGGNTRGIAHEIQRQTGADLIEITMADPYSTSYNTVLMEAQEAQHRQDRPELAVHVENMDEYDTVLLGYPNWWASIPMPIATFLESYDFSGKQIIPFCSHGGGRFGQSLTAIAKLAPDAVMGQGLAVSYSGGASLADDIKAWLAANHISGE